MSVSGYAGVKTRSVLKFPIVAGSTPCAEGYTVPSGMQVRSAALRLFTWKVNGAVDCATDCWHVLKRATSTWSENAVSWNTTPSTMSVGNELFQHGTGTGDFGPRYQLVSGPGLSTDVGSFYSVPSSNQGWVIDQACAPEYPGRNCNTPDGAFLMRTSEWTDPAQRPQLSIVFGPSLTSSKQIRNVAFGTCASVLDDEGSGSFVVAQPCAGKGWQAWNYDADKRFIGLNNNMCMETGNNSSGKPDVKNYGCHGNDWQKWTVVGSAIKYVPDSNMCLEIRDGNQAIGTKLTINGCNGRPEQQWAIEPLITTPAPGLPVRLRNIAGNNCADVAIHQSAGNPNPGTWMQLFPCMGSERTPQSFIPMADGRFVLVTNNSYCLDWPTNGGPNRVTINNCHQGANQQWIREIGGRLRNLKNGKCLTGGNDINWLQLSDCEVTYPTSQQWLIEPSTSPPLADVGQYQNAASKACLEPISAPFSGGDLMEVPCDATRPNQKFIRLNNGEIRPLSTITLCFDIADGAIEKLLELYDCHVIDEFNNPANKHQQFDLNADGQLVNRKNSVCVQGLGPGVRTKSKTCDSGLLSQKWTFGVPSGATPAQQIRNVGFQSCLDGVNQSGNGAGMWPCSGQSRPQQAIMVFVLSEAAGVKTVELRKADNINKCLDQQDNAGLNARSQWLDCTGSNYQKWVVSPTATTGQVRIASFNQQGRCITGGEDESLARLQDCADFDSNPNKRWVIEAPADSRQIVQIRNGSTSGCIDVKGATVEGANLTDFPCLGSARPAQAFMKLNNKTFMSMANNALCLDRNSTGVVGNIMLLWTCNRANSQKFDASNDPLVAGQFKNSDTGRCAELRPSSNNIQAQNCVSSGATQPFQSWYVEPVQSNGAPPVQFRNTSGWCIDVTLGFDSDTAQALPCLGDSRLNQQYAFSGTGLVRLRTNPTMCFDSQGNVVGKTLIAYACDSSNDNQSWVIDGGRLRNKRGGTLGNCVQGGTEGNRFTMQACSNSPTQQLLKEAAGTSPKADAIGHLRVAGTTTCLDPDVVVTNSNEPHIWAWPCTGNTREQQLVLPLANGQIRSYSDLTRCLDANNGGEGEWLFFTSCTTPATRNAQLFDLDADKFRSRTNGVNARCVQGGGEGTKLSQTACVSGVGGQKWVYEPVAP